MQESFDVVVFAPDPRMLADMGLVEQATGGQGDQLVVFLENLLDCYVVQVDELLQLQVFISNSLGLLGEEPSHLFLSLIRHLLVCLPGQIMDLLSQVARYLGGE